MRKSRGSMRSARISLAWILGAVRAGRARTLPLRLHARLADELSLAFDATALAPLPPGWTRTFLLYAHGYSKEMDINSASPEQVAPLPFRRMREYPYRWPETYPHSPAHLDYLE